MPKGTPSHLRVRLGLELRDAREAVGLKQTEAGAIIGCGQPKIANIENASVKKIVPGELAKLLEAYGITGARAEQLKSWARSPYQVSGVYQEPSSSGPTWWQEHEEIERQARVIKAVQIQAMDGLVQHEAYMRKQFELVNATNVGARVEKRLRRQKLLFESNNPPQCTFILDEACFKKNMGAPDMMAQQIEHLLALVKKHPFITILIQPFGAEYPAYSHGFTMLQFDNAMMSDFVSIVYGERATTVDNEAELRRFQLRWEQIRAVCLKERQSIRFMQRELARYRERGKEPGSE